MKPNLQLNLRASGQAAFNELTSDMGFGLGSGVGLRGLPGTLISGDTGWLSTGELNWTVWQNSNQALQLVPFIGMGYPNHTRLGELGRHNWNRWVVAALATRKTLVCGSGLGRSVQCQRQRRDLERLAAGQRCLRQSGIQILRQVPTHTNKQRF